MEIDDGVDFSHLQQHDQDVRPESGEPSAIFELDSNNTSYPLIRWTMSPRNRANDVQVARKAAEHPSLEDLQDLQEAWAEVLASSISPSPAFSGHEDSSHDRWLFLESVNAAGLLAMHVLFDSFFYRCGFRDSMDFEISGRERREWHQRKDCENREKVALTEVPICYNAFTFTSTERKYLIYKWQQRSQPAGTRAKCVARTSNRLMTEAGLSTKELTSVLVEKVFRGRADQNQAAHEQVIGILANHLLKFFRANRDDEVRSIIEKVFKWMTGMGLVEAFKKEDDRILTRKGVQGPEPLLDRSPMELDEEERGDLEEFMGSFA